MDMKIMIAAVSTSVLVATGPTGVAQERAHDREHDADTATQAQVRAERATAGKVETRAQIGALEDDTDAATIWGDPEREVRLERIEDDHVFRTGEEPALEDEYLAEYDPFPLADDRDAEDETLTAIAPVRVPDPETLAGGSRDRR